jgi:acyl-CoA synthetase (AMP-forming)/AMP-acid ligase II
MNPKNIAKNGNFTNFMMGMIAAPVVLAWVGLSIFLVVSAFNDPSVVADIESYKSVLLIIGAPALVIIYKVLELWTAQQNSDIEQTRKETFSGEEEEQA